MDMIAECIALVLQSEDNIEKVKGMVAELTAKYPLDMWGTTKENKTKQEIRLGKGFKVYPGGFYCCLNKMSNSEKIEQNI